jgi:hypothetical protein
MSDWMRRFYVRTRETSLRSGEFLRSGDLPLEQRRVEGGGGPAFAPSAFAHAPQARSGVTAPT